MTRDSSLKRARWALTSMVRRVAGERGYIALQLRWLAHSLRTGRGAEPEASFLRWAVKPGDTVVDVGANLGFYSYRLAKLVGPGGRVVAVEPMPQTRALLEQLLERTGVAGTVDVVASGVSDQAGTATFQIELRPDGSPQYGRAWSPHPSREATAAGVTVEMRRLDDVVDGDVAFAKIDVEGAELFALRGAERLLTGSAPTLLMEVSAATLARQGVEREAVRELLDGFGYATYVWDPERERLLPVSAAEHDGNLIAVHPRRRDRLTSLLSG